MSNRPPLDPLKLSRYKPGKNIRCKIVETEPGGYSIVNLDDDLPGFLPTLAKLKIGTEIIAQFVCVHDNRIMLAAREVPGNDSPTQTSGVPRKPMPFNGPYQASKRLPEPEDNSRDR